MGQHIQHWDSQAPPKHSSPPEHHHASATPSNHRLVTSKNESTSTKNQQRTTEHAAPFWEDYSGTPVRRTCWDTINSSQNNTGIPQPHRHHPPHPTPPHPTPPHPTEYKKLGHTGAQSKHHRKTTGNQKRFRDLQSTTKTPAKPSTRTVQTPSKHIGAPPRKIQKQKHKTNKFYPTTNLAIPGTTNAPANKPVDSNLPDAFGECSCCLFDEREAAMAHMPAVFIVSARRIPV